MSRLTVALFALLIFCTGLTACATDTDAKKTVEPTDRLAVEAATQMNLPDPDDDANAAIASNQYTLLAFANKVLSVPGVDMQTYPLALLQSQCGVRVLSGTGDTVKMGESLEQRKALRQYAQRYNQLVFHACQIFQKNYNAVQQ